ncbi:MAG: DUF3180 domain-containing protein [Ancrocorticia sp.]
MKLTPWWLIPGWLALGTIFGISITMFFLRGFGVVPPLPKITPLVVLAVVAVLLWLGWQVRRVKERKAAAIGGLGASSVAVFAVASAHSGALLVGVFGVMSALYWIDAVGHYMMVQAITAGCTALASLILSVAGFVVERWCRISGDDGDAAPTGAGAAA